ncbi:hypothetical protein M501DRAFT_997488 [Patellaria atrata CBS 101060]|uniref:Vps41 beta-propeller domain-containing protein n=1 Tax=Patellaria atrata CBS 101060 TaxID=1346257 RepID=A0A9P4S4B7_9PEZI|nr:hypothetical protein M501DRAFT_997488 [Patellaria atrata CBS 101060]
MSAESEGPELNDGNNEKEGAQENNPSTDIAGPPIMPFHERDTKRLGEAEDSEEDEEEDDEEEDEEPKLKYSVLTSSLGSVYRNGDATSSFLVAGDKMIIGTHNGNIHAITIPTFQSLRFYHAHSASVTAVSISPFPPPFPNARSEVVARLQSESRSTSSKASSIKSNPTTGASPRTPRTPKQVQVPTTPSNSIYIATSSIDGHVCVSSLIDPKDVTLRNFARPVQAVALSPDYKNDRTYLSGGLAGNLIMTSGGKAGVSANANTNSAAAAASGWLGSIGLGANTGKDTVLHSGEGTINTIKWSLSGKYVVWVNEQGIKFMRSGLYLESADSESAWKRIGHFDRPNRRTWEDMAGVWKARAEWIDDKNLEADEDLLLASTEPQEKYNRGNKSSIKSSVRKDSKEKVVVGWGDCAWVFHVNMGGAGMGKTVGERSVGSVDVVHSLRFGDCIVSGLSLYTPSLLLVLAYRTRDDDDEPITPTAQTTPRRGVHHRQNGIKPQLRIIDLSSEDKEEVDVDTLTVSRFESLSAADYHLSTLYIPPAPDIGPAQRNALEAIGGGLWDAGANAKRIFSSGASIISFANSGDNDSITSPGPTSTQGVPSISSRRIQDAHPSAANVGLKIFMHSPYDCILAVKRDASDHLNWLLEHDNYKAAWELIDNHPEVISTPSSKQPDSTPSTPSKRGGSLVEFFADDNTSQETILGARAHNSAVEKEKRRIGDLWVQQLVSAKDWNTGGQVAGRVLGTSSRWEHWVWTFAQAGKFDEITPYIPSKQLHPPLPSEVYEVVLGHYIIRDRLKLRDLLEQWDPELFDINSVTSAIEAKLKAGDVTEDTVEAGEKGRDWRILLDSLAKLYVASSRVRDALRCYIRLQNPDAAMSLIRSSHLLDTVADDIPGFVLLRVSEEQLDSAPLNELEDLSAEAIHLLVDEAYEGVVRPNVVVDQLKAKGLSFQPFLFFYLRELWNGFGTDKRFGTGAERIAREGRTMVEDFADLAVELYAEYDRQLLMSLLKSSTSYSFEKASSVCESRQYIPELVYLLSKTGQTKRALFLIIDKLRDVSQAITFAKDQDDPDLWNDLLDYSMDKPRFIRGLLEEVGTAINPITLVRRIPEGLEIEGLRDGIHRMIREYELQFSISDGVARVLRGEVATGMDRLREGQKRGVKFEVMHQDPPEEAPGDVKVFVEPVEGPGHDDPPTELEPETVQLDKNVKPGHCVGCKKIFMDDEKETLVGFACGHVYHLSCLLDITTSKDPAAESAVRILKSQLADAAEDEYSYYSRSVGAKVAHAHLIRNVLKGGCPVCIKQG